MTKADKLMAAIEQDMIDMDFSEARKFVAYQNGNLRRTIDYLCDDEHGVDNQATAYLSVVAGLNIIDSLEESTIELLAQALRDEAVSA